MGTFTSNQKSTSNQESSAVGDSDRAGPRPDSAVPAVAAKRASCRLRTLTGVQVLGTGSYVPDEVVRNEDLAELGYDADWILQRTGIRQRRRAAADQATSDLACHAARRCIEQAGVAASEIDLVLVGTFSPDTLTPSTACRVQHALGLDAPAMDVNAACAGFMYALVTGMQYVASGCSQYALVVGADTLSRLLNPADKKTFPLFGDAAGAVLLGGGGERQGLLAYTLGADGSGGNLLCVPAGGSREPLSPEGLAGGRQFLSMDGRPVFKWAVRLVSDTIKQVLGHAGLTIGEIDVVVLHQANIRIIDAAVSDLNIPREKVIINLDRYGNTSAGSIPLVLDEAQRSGRIQRGDHVLLCGFGAGLAWGTAVMKW